MARIYSCILLAFALLVLLEARRAPRLKRRPPVNGGSRSTTQQAPPPPLPDEPRDVTPEEVQEITDDVKETETVEHSSDKENGDEWVREWASVMDDFQAEVMFRTEIQPKSDEVYFHMVKEGEEVNLRGAYFTSDSTQDRNAVIDFFVLDDERRVIFSRRKRSEGIFSINATKPGEYSFIFSNLKSRTTKNLMVTLQTAPLNVPKEQLLNREDFSKFEAARPLANEESYLKEEELQDLLSKFSKIQMNLQAVQTEQRVSNTRQDEHNRVVEVNNKYSWWVTASEVVFFLGLAGFQVYYIMNMLENKRLLL